MRLIFLIILKKNAKKLKKVLEKYNVSRLYGTKKLRDRKGEEMQK